MKKWIAFCLLLAALLLAVWAYYATSTVQSRTEAVVSFKEELPSVATAGVRFDVEELAKYDWLAHLGDSDVCQLLVRLRINIGEMSVKKQAEPETLMRMNIALGEMLEPMPKCQVPHATPAMNSDTGVQ